MKKILALIIAINLVQLAHAGGKYTVISKIYNDGKMIGSPTLFVDPNKETSISISDLYSYTLTVNPVNETSVIVLAYLNTGAQELSPELAVEIGKEASIEVGDQKLSVLVNKSGN